MVRAQPSTSGVQVASVRAKVSHDSRAQTTASAVAVSQANGAVTVDVPDAFGRGRSPQVLVEVAAALGTDIRATVGEADVVCVGDVGDLHVHTTSGSVHAEQVLGKLEVRSGRGPVTVHRCFAGAELTVSDASVILRAVQGPLTVRGRSGDVDVWWLAGPAQISTTTGNVRVGWAQGRPVDLDLRTSGGRISTDLSSDPDASETLLVSTISGDIRVHSSAPRPL